MYFDDDFPNGLPEDPLDAAGGPRPFVIASGDEPDLHWELLANGMLFTSLPAVPCINFRVSGRDQLEDQLRHMPSKVVFQCAATLGRLVGERLDSHHHGRGVRVTDISGVERIYWSTKLTPITGEGTERWTIRIGEHVLETPLTITDKLTYTGPMLGDAIWFLSHYRQISRSVTNGDNVVDFQLPGLRSAADVREDFRINYTVMGIAPTVIAIHGNRRQVRGVLFAPSAQHPHPMYWDAMKQTPLVVSLYDLSRDELRHFDTRFLAEASTLLLQRLAKDADVSTIHRPVWVNLERYLLHKEPALEISFRRHSRLHSVTRRLVGDGHHLDGTPSLPTRSEAIDLITAMGNGRIRVALHEGRVL